MGQFTLTIAEIEHINHLRSLSSEQRRIFFYEARKLAEVRLPLLDRERLSPGIFGRRPRTARRSQSLMPPPQSAEASR